MAKAKQKRWRCPVCELGILGPLRPRLNDVRRYCLPCSAKTGRLVERYAPADKAKAARVAAKKARPTAGKKKPRRSKLDFMRAGGGTVRVVGGYEVNYWLVARKMLRSKKWGRVVARVAKAKPDSVKREFSWSGVSAERASDWMRWHWDQTVKHKGAGKRSGLVFPRKNDCVKASGNATYKRSCVVLCGNHASNLNVLLHELVHVVHLQHFGASLVNGKRRPHDYVYNMIFLQMAAGFFGYPNNGPYANGWSVGRGYEPTRRVERWLGEQIRNGNQKVTAWLVS